MNGKRASACVTMQFMDEEISLSACRALREIWGRFFRVSLRNNRCAMG